MRHVAVIDIGKTNAKLALVDAEAMAEVAVRTRPNSVLAGPPYPHFDIEGIWAFLKEAIAELNRAHSIDAISITTHGATAALVDERGDLVLPVLDYEHDGPDADRAGFEAISPPFAVTLTPRLPAGLNLGAQLFYQKTRWPEAFARLRHVLTYPQYWAFRLTGIVASELTSLGCHTGLWDFTRGELSSSVAAMGLDGAFPPIRSAFDRLGEITSELAAELGLAGTVPVYCGIHDSNASLLPHVLLSPPPFSVVSTGTWVVVCSPGGAVQALDEARDSLANIDALGRTVPSARFMGGREFSLLTGGEDRNPGPSAMARLLDDGIMLLPSVQPGSGPFPNRKARWTVEPDNLDPDTRFVAISAYLALMTAQCLALTGAAGPIAVEGPFARNGVFLEMLGAATARPVSANPGNATGTSLGAALLALGPDAKPHLRYSAIAPHLADRAKMAAYAGRWRALVAESR